MTACMLLVPEKKRARQSGFSLVELAVVMVVLGMLLGGLLMPMSTQRELNKQRATDASLQEIYAALLGYAALNGRLPCPATTASNGLSAPNAATTNCQQEHGFVPGRTLGLDGNYNANNLLTDAWTNPIRYSLTTANGGAYSNQVNANLLGGNYRICQQSGCAAANIIAENVVAVIHSRGKDGALAPTSANQQENNDNDADFVKATYSEAGNNQFDDICRWISPNVLALELLRAGKLP